MAAITNRRERGPTGSSSLPGFVTEAVSGSLVMSVVGVIEIAAGIGVWLRPKIFAPVVAAWLSRRARHQGAVLLGALALWRLARAHADRCS